MTIEKAFAVQAAPGDVWQALWDDLSSGDQTLYAVEESHRPSLLCLRLKLGDLPVLLTYRIERTPEHTEVAATIEPQSRRYLLYQLLTFGHLRRNYEMLLVEGLANLKRSLEGGPEQEATGVEAPEDVGQEDEDLTDAR